MNNVHPLFQNILAAHIRTHDAIVASVSPTPAQRLKALHDRLCGQSHAMNAWMQFGGAKPEEPAPSLKAIREALDRRLVVMTELKAEIDAGAPTRHHPRALDVLRSDLAKLRNEYDEATDELEVITQAGV